MLLKNPLPHIVLLFICVCVRVCSCVWRYLCVGGGVHAAGALMSEEARDNPQVSFFGICPSCFVETGMLWGSLCWLGRHVWVASETQRSAGLCHPSAKITNAHPHAQFFTWVLRVKLGFSMIAWQAFLLIGPPRYFLFSFCGDHPQVSPPSMFQYYYYSIISLIYKPFPMDSITLSSE